MQFTKARPFLFALLGIPLLITCGVIFFKHLPTTLIAYHYLHWAVLAMLLLVLVLPCGHRRLAAKTDEPVQHHGPIWLFKIISIQLFLLATFIGLTHFIGEQVPIFTGPHPHLIQQTLDTLLFSMGGLPWASIAMCAAAIGYVSFYQQRHAFPSAILSSLVTSTPENLIGSISNNFTRQATNIVFTTTFAFMILIVARLITPDSIPFLHGFYFNTMILTFAVLLIMISRRAKVLMRRIIAHKIPLAFGMILMVAIVASIFAVLNWFLHDIANIAVTAPGLLKTITSINWIEVWMLFAICWWMGWSFIIGTAIARISRGYRVRTVILGSLLLPALLAAWMHFGQAKWPLDIQAAWVYNLIGILGYIGLCKVLCSKAALPSLVFSYLEKNGNYKHRDHHYFIQYTVKIAAVIIYIYLAMGLFVVSFLIFFASFIACLLMILFSLSMLNMRAAR